MLTTVLLVGSALVPSTVSGVVGMAGGSLLLVVMVVLGIDPLLSVPIHAAVQVISNGSRALVDAERFGAGASAEGLGLSGAAGVFHEAMTTFVATAPFPPRV